MKRKPVSVAIPFGVLLALILVVWGSLLLTGEVVPRSVFKTSPQDAQ
jgi:hypothetical protein